MLTLLTIVCTVGGYAQETATDELTATILNVSTNGYKKFATKTLSSGASYDGAAYVGTGKSQKGIQIRTKVDKGLYTGIITSASGGTIKSITINFNSSNAQSLEIYGKNTAYTTAKDLFGSAAGELIKNVPNSKTAVTITPNKAYKFIGFKSNDGTNYIDKITIVWEKAATTPPPLPPLVPAPARHSHSPMARLRVLPRLQLPLQRATTTPTCLTLLNIQALTRTS